MFSFLIFCFIDVLMQCCGKLARIQRDHEKCRIWLSMLNSVKFWRGCYTLWLRHTVLNINIVIAYFNFYLCMKFRWWRPIYRRFDIVLKQVTLHEGRRSFILKHLSYLTSFFLTVCFASVFVMLSQLVVFRWTFLSGETFHPWTCCVALLKLTLQFEGKKINLKR